VPGDRGGCQLGSRSLKVTRPVLAQLRRVGVEAEADLTAALFNERRKSIREIGQLVPSL
jgi:hypothetical protein